MDNGIVAYVTPEGKGPSFEISGEKGRLSTNPDIGFASLRPEGAKEAQVISLPTVDEAWAAGPAMVRDLVEAVVSGSRTGCDVHQVRRATEIGFAIHCSSANNGSKVWLPAADRSLRVESFAWGNEK